MPFLEQNVGGLDVAMNNAARVGERERVRDLTQHPERFRDGNPSATLEPLTQRLAGDVRHDVVEEIPTRASREDGQNMRVLQPGGELNFTLKACGTYLTHHF